MSTSATMARLAATSPRTKARIAGALYLLTILLGGVGESVHGRLVVPGDAAATASNILTHTSLMRLGFAAYMTEMASQIAMTALFYDLLEPVSRSVSLLAACFSLVGIAIKTLSPSISHRCWCWEAPITWPSSARHSGRPWRCFSSR